jgi:hypothetical protein
MRQEPYLPVSKPDFRPKAVWPLLAPRILLLLLDAVHFGMGQDRQMSLDSKIPRYFRHISPVCIAN